MGDDLISYMERLELMAFFAGYPLIYAIVHVIAGAQHKKKFTFSSRLLKLLPFAYALTGTLFLGLMLKNMYPDYSLKNIAEQFQTSWLRIFGLLSILFWIPLLSKKSVFSLLHSLVFFFFLLKDLFMHISSATTGNEVIKNDMKIYTDSLLLNTGTLAVMVILYFIFTGIQKKRQLPDHKSI